MSKFGKPSRSTLCPLLPTWSSELERVQTRLARLGIPRTSADLVRERRASDPVRMAEQPFRAANQRRRLQAFYWLRWWPVVAEGFLTPRQRYAFYGTVKPTWTVRP